MKPKRKKRPMPKPTYNRAEIISNLKVMFGIDAEPFGDDGISVSKAGDVAKINKVMTDRAIDQFKKVRSMFMALDKANIDFEIIDETLG